MNWIINSFLRYSSYSQRLLELFTPYSGEKFQLYSCSDFTVSQH